MIKQFAVLAAGALIAWDAAAGTISGSVRAQGKPGAEADGQSGKYDSRQFKFAERVDYNAMREFVVYIEGATGPTSEVTETRQVVTRRIKQHGAMFEPHILPIVRGTTVEWPNDDDILHNVFSVSESNPFDLGLYKSPKVERWKFDKPGRVDVFCSIHTRMNCIILVLENPYFASTNEKGRYIIPNVPAGAYKLKAWHERLPAQTRDIVVSENNETKADFVLGITNLPKPASNANPVAAEK